MTDIADMKSLIDRYQDTQATLCFSRPAESGVSTEWSDYCVFESLRDAVRRIVDDKKRQNEYIYTITVHVPDDPKLYDAEQIPDLVSAFLDTQGEEQC